MFLISSEIVCLSIAPYTHTATQETNWIILKLYFTKSFLFRLTAGWCTRHLLHLCDPTTLNQNPSNRCDIKHLCYCTTVLLLLLLLLLLGINVHWSRWLAGTNTHNSFDVCCFLCNSLSSSCWATTTTMFQIHNATTHSIRETHLRAHIVRAAKISTTT